MGTPEQPTQDTYSNGFDVVRILSNEFGNSPTLVRSQVINSGATIEIDDVPYTGDRLFIPVDMAAGKLVTVIGPERQWRMKFPNKPE